MKLNRFEVVSGKYIEEISGQSRIGYSMSDTTDFYDMIEWSKKGGYQGSIISFYDYNNGKIYEPFQKQRNVLYGPPVYLKNSFWFLQGELNKYVKLVEPNYNVILYCNIFLLRKMKQDHCCSKNISLDYIPFSIDHSMYHS